MKIENRKVTGFSSIELRAFGKMDIRQGETESLTIEADEETLNKIISRVDNGKLILELGQNWFERVLAGLQSIGGKSVKYTITVKDLNKLRIMGWSEVHIPELHATNLELSVSGAGEIHIPFLEAERLDVDISGRGEVDISGRVTTQDIQVTGSGEFDGETLESQNTSVRISGHGEVDVSVSELLDVKIAGYGEVTYKGEPKVSQSISGAGSVKRHTA